MVSVMALSSELETKLVRSCVKKYTQYLRWCVELQHLKIAIPRDAAKIAETARIVKAWQISYLDEQDKLFENNEE